jgi:hypothetical protein
MLDDVFNSILKYFERIRSDPLFICRNYLFAISHHIFIFMILSSEVLNLCRLPVVVSRLSLVDCDAVL